MQPEQEYLLNVVLPLVQNKDAVKVDYQNDDRGVLLVLNVAPEDMPRVIGRQGANANAIRNLVRQVGFTNNKRVSVKIEEPEGSTRRQGHAHVDSAFEEAKNI